MAAVRVAPRAAEARAPAHTEVVRVPIRAAEARDDGAPARGGAGGPADAPRECRTGTVHRRSSRRAAGPHPGDPGPATAFIWWNAEL